MPCQRSVVRWVRPARERVTARPDQTAGLCPASAPCVSDTTVAAAHGKLATPHRGAAPALDQDPIERTTRLVVSPCQAQTEASGSRARQSCPKADRKEDRRPDGPEGACHPAPGDGPTSAKVGRARLGAFSPGGADPTVLRNDEYRSSVRSSRKVSKPGTSQVSIVNVVVRSPATIFVTLAPLEWGHLRVEAPSSPAEASRSTYRAADGLRLEAARQGNAVLKASVCVHLLEGRAFQYASRSFRLLLPVGSTSRARPIGRATPTASRCPAGSCLVGVTTTSVLVGLGDDSAIAVPVVPEVTPGADQDVGRHISQSPHPYQVAPDVRALAVWNDDQ